MKRYIEYVLGLMTMAAGVVLMKKAALGITPITSLPLSLSEVLPMSLGNFTILFHVVCILAIVAVERRVTLKTALMLPVGVGFGYFIDLLLLLLPGGVSSLPLRVLLLAAGIPVSGLGVALVNDADLMLPSPDGLMRTVSARFGIKYPTVKLCGDCLWVALALAVELVFLRRIEAVGIGTAASALLVAPSIRLWNKYVFRRKA